jgi:PhzF family phenazine biosynthesis protein
MRLPIYQVDAFTDRLFAGNPAAVVLCDAALPVDAMQNIAAENNLSETAFVVLTESGHQIRWFTPTVEVDLCGHATLAAAHVIFNHLKFSGKTVSFSSKSGPLLVRRAGEILYLDFPADSIRTVDPMEPLISGLGVMPAELYRGRDDFLAIFENEDRIARLAPDMALISKLTARGVIVSSIGDEVDFVSRFFGPQSGVPEDPVTGSAHTTLIPYWSKKLAKTNLRARQISGRGGDLKCQNLGQRVEIGGQAVTYLVGEIFLDLGEGPI